MENTGRFVFGGGGVKNKSDRTHNAVWYLAEGDQWMGPFTSEEIVHKIQMGQTSVAHYIWKKGYSTWKRILEVNEFQEMLPPAPAKSLLSEVRAGKPQDAGEGKREWFLHYNDAQFGPFHTGEVEHYLKTGKLHGRVYAWKDGLKDWTRLEQLPEFQSETKMKVMKSGAPKKDSPNHKSPGQKSNDQRKGARRPLVAKVWMTDQKSVLLGLCRDISVGGLQVLTERIPGEPGDVLKLNISMSTRQRGPQLEPIVAEGEIVRILEDGRGFSFRFKKLSADAREQIEKFIEAS